MELETNKRVHPIVSDHLAHGHLAQEHTQCGDIKALLYEAFTVGEMALFLKDHNFNPSGIIRNNNLFQKLS